MLFPYIVAKFGLRSTSQADRIFRNNIPEVSSRLCWGQTGSSGELKLIYDRQSVGQSILVSGAHLEPVTNFSFAMKFPADSCGFVIL
jgi:hypothetical protein